MKIDMIRDDFNKTNSSSDNDESINKVKQKNKLAQLNTAITNATQQCNHLKNELVIKKNNFSSYAQQHITSLVGSIDSQDYYRQMPKRPEPPKFMEYTAEEKAFLYKDATKNSDSCQYIGESRYGRWSKSAQNFKQELIVYEQNVKKYTESYHINRLKSLIDTGYYLSDTEEQLLAKEIYKKYQDVSELSRMIKKLEVKIERVTKEIELLDKQVQQPDTLTDELSSQEKQQDLTEILQENKYNTQDSPIINITTNIEESDADHCRNIAQNFRARLQGIIEKQQGTTSDEEEEANNNKEIKP